MKYFEYFKLGRQYTCNNTDKYQFIQKHTGLIINTVIVRNFGFRYKHDFNVYERAYLGSIWLGLSLGSALLLVNAHSQIAAATIKHDVMRCFYALKGSRLRFIFTLYVN